MGVASGYGEQEVGVASESGCGCKEVHVYRFDHTILIPTPLVSSFLQQHCSFFNVFRSLIII